MFEYVSEKIKAKWEKRNDDEKIFIILVITTITLELYVFFSGVDETPFNMLVQNAAKDFFLYVKIFGMYFLWRLIRKRVIKNKMFYIVWILMFVLSIPYIPILCGYETKQIGDFYEAREYTQKYYVKMSRNPNGTFGRKQYTLPAEIERRLDYDYTVDEYEDYYFQTHGGYDVYKLAYHINQLYFPNGGYLSFDFDSAKLQVDKEVEVEDYHGDTYYITLTKEKAK